MKENSIEENIKILKQMKKDTPAMPYDCLMNKEMEALDTILLDYEKIQEDNEKKDELIEKLVKELEQDDINMTRKYKEKKGITGELLGIDKVRVRAYREKTREIKEKLHKLLSD